MEEGERGVEELSVGGWAGMFSISGDTTVLEGIPEESLPFRTNFERLGTYTGNELLLLPSTGKEVGGWLEALEDPGRDWT